MLRKSPLTTGSIYHIFNRGVDKQNIFFERWDYLRFLNTAKHYRTKNNKFSYELITPINDTVSLEKPQIQILAYCLMPNHFHFLIKQIEENGITAFMRRILNSYAHYINLKRGRLGPLFAGPFKNVLIETDEQLVHVSRYIHLNPVVSGLVRDIDSYEWSSYSTYVGEKNDGFCETGEVAGFFKSADVYRQFVSDQVDYGKRLEEIKHLTFDHP